MSSFLGQAQSSISDMIRFSLLHSITSRNTDGKGTNVYDTLHLVAIFVLISMLSNVSLSSTLTSSYMRVRDSIKSFFFRKHIIKIRAQTTTASTVYNVKPHVTTIYTDDFKALWSYILNNIKTNSGIYELKEIKNMIRVYANEDSYFQTEGTYIVSQKEHFVLDEDLGIYAYTNEDCERTDEKVFSTTENYEITIYSYISNMSILKQYIDTQRHKYLTELAESRHNKRFMYTLVNTDYHSQPDTRYCWRENEFHSSKTFQNVFFDKKQEIIDKLDFFLHNREWYDKHGIPYTLGIGLYGPPGTGKTSFIKALANYVGGRHLINMPMVLIKTKKQLNDFYYESRYSELNTANSVNFMKKIIVIEDIDCAGDIVLERSTSKKKVARKKTKTNEKDELEDFDYTEIQLNDTLAKMDQDIQHAIRENIAEESRKLMTRMNTPLEEQITLDDILNLWDGIRETPGRILIISSNHYEKLDMAIRRPGRIDITLGLENASHTVIAEMYAHFYHESIDMSEIETIPEGQYSPAEIVNFYTMHRNDKKGFIDRLRREPFDK